MLEQELRAHYEPPRNLPHRLLTLLMKLNDRVGNSLRGIKTAARRRGEREDEMEQSEPRRP